MYKLTVKFYWFESTLERARPRFSLKQKIYRKNVDEIYYPLWRRLKTLLERKQIGGLDSVIKFWKDLKDRADDKRVRPKLKLGEYIDKLSTFQSKLPRDESLMPFIPHLEEETEVVIEEINGSSGGGWLEENEDKLEELVPELKELWKDVINDSKKIFDEVYKIIIKVKKAS